MCCYYTVPPETTEENMIHKREKKENDDKVKLYEVSNPLKVSLTSSLKESRCGFHQKTFLVGAEDKDWGESIPQTALTGLCASLESLRL